MLWRRKWQPTPVFLPGESQGRRSLVGCRLWGRTELDATEQLSSSSRRLKGWTSLLDLGESLTSLHTCWLLWVSVSSSLRWCGRRIWDRWFFTSFPCYMLLIICLKSKPPQHSVNVSNLTWFYIVQIFRHHSIHVSQHINTLSGMENKFMVTKGDSREWGEFGINSGRSFELTDIHHYI